MSSAALSTSILLLLICFVGHGSCGSPTENNGTITWNDDFQEKNEGSGLETEYDAKGLQPWYNFANSFISTVLNKDPYELALKAKAGDLTTDNLKDEVILGYAIGMVICVGIGVLFCLIMPIVGLCFCCCRCCCGKCGGEMSQKDSPNNNCKRAVFGVILLMITLLMFAGVLLTFVCNDRMSDTVDGMVDTSKGILNEAIFFINRTVGEAEKLFLVDFPFVIGRLKSDLTDDSLTNLVGDPLLQELDQVSVEPIKAVRELSIETQTMRDQLETIRSNSDNLSRLAGDLDTGLTTARNNLTEVLNDCSSLPGPPPFCNNIDVENLAADANFTNLPNISSELQSIEEVVNQDFEKSAEEGLKEVTNIPQKVINETRGTRADINQRISNASDSIRKIRNDMRKIADDDVIKKLEKYRDTDVPNIQKDAETYDKYRWIAGVALTCFLLLIVVLMALGLMCGVCGHDKEATPTVRGTVSNMGGLSLMAAAGFCFIFASLLMLLTTICFIIGAPAQAVCSSVLSGELYKEVIDKPSFWGADGNPLSKAIFQDSNIEFSIGSFIDNCRQNMPLYKAAQFDRAFNVTKKLDIEELLGNQSTQEFDKLNVNLSDVNILSNETRYSLIDLGQSGVDDINFDAFLNETRKGITTVNLREFARNVSDLATQFQTLGKNLSGNDQDKAFRLGNRSGVIAQDLRLLHNKTVAVMETQSKALDGNVRGLRSIGSNLKGRANVTLKKAEEAETYLHTQSSVKMNEIVRNYTDRVLGWGYQFTDHVLDVVNNKLAKCKPITNIYDAALVVVCKQALYPFNGFWFSIGYCLFFFIPAIIFCVKLAKHYRRMDYESDFDQGWDAEMVEMAPTSAPPVYGDKKVWANQNGYPPPNYQ